MSTLARQDVDCQRQAPLIQTVHTLLIRSGMERTKAFDLADQIVKTLEPTIGSGLLTIFHNNLLSVMTEMISHRNGGPLKPRHAEMLKDLLESIELHQRAFGDAMNAAKAENLTAKR